MYSDFYEIPLPALCFEKVEETDTKKSENDTEEKKTTPSKIRQNQKAERKTTLTTLREKQIHSQQNDTRRRLKNASKTKAFVIREIKLTHSKNGRH